MRVLGIDPGLTRCGLGVVDGHVGRPLRWSPSAWSAPRPTCPTRAAAARDRAAIEAWLDEHQPDAVAVERVFSQHNVRTVMGTAQASGVALVAAARRGMPVALHTPSEVKAAVTGNGRADKAQVGAMVTRLLRLDAPPKPGRRRRRARAGHLPHLAWRRAGPHRRGRPAGGRRKESAVIAFVTRHGRRRDASSSRRRSRSAASASSCTARPAPWPRCASGSRPRCRPAWSCARSRSPCSASSTTTRSRSSSCCRPPAASGPSWRRRCSPCTRPDDLRRAVTAEDVRR